MELKRRTHLNHWPMGHWLRLAAVGLQTALRARGLKLAPSHPPTHGLYVTMHPSIHACMTRLSSAWFVSRGMRCACDVMCAGDQPARHRSHAHERGGERRHHHGRARLRHERRRGELAASRSAPSLAACWHAVQAKALAVPCASVSGKNAFRTHEHTTMAR